MQRQKIYPAWGRQPARKKVLGPFVFTWVVTSKSWQFKGKFYTINVEPTCGKEDAKSWLKAFLAAEAESSALHNGQRITHTLGVTQSENEYVSATDDTEITWFNIAPQDRLFAVALSDASKDAPKPIQLTRMIHHEAAHSYESEMRDWLASLTPDISKLNLKPIAQELDVQYLPDQLEFWAKRRKRYPQKAAEIDEDMAAEFLVEAYAHLVQRKKPWKFGLWPRLDTLAQPMKKRVLTTNPKYMLAHTPISSKERIMYVPRTIIVKKAVSDDGIAMSLIAP